MKKNEKIFRDKYFPVASQHKKFTIIRNDQCKLIIQELRKYKPAFNSNDNNYNEVIDILNSREILEKGSINKIKKLIPKIDRKTLSLIEKYRIVNIICRNYSNKKLEIMKDILKVIPMPEFETLENKYLK